MERWRLFISKINEKLQKSCSSSEHEDYFVHFMVHNREVLTILILSTCPYSPRACMLVATPCLIIYNSHTITVEMVRSTQVLCSAARLAHGVLLTVAQLNYCMLITQERNKEN